MFRFKNFLNRIKAVYYALVIFTVNLIFALPAYADDNEIPDVDPGSFAGKIIGLIKDIGMPIGGAILFVSVCLIAVKLMISGFSSDARSRSEAMGGLIWVAGGGIILGAAMFLAGFFLGIGEKL